MYIKMQFYHITWIKVKFKTFFSPYIAKVVIWLVFDDYDGTW